MMYLIGSDTEYSRWLFARKTSVVAELCSIGSNLIVEYEFLPFFVVVHICFFFLEMTGSIHSLVVKWYANDPSGSFENCLISGAI